MKRQTGMMMISSMMTMTYLMTNQRRLSGRNAQSMKILKHNLVTLSVRDKLVFLKMILIPSLYSGFNETVRGKRTLKTGKTDISDKGMMVTVEDRAELGNWSEASCNHVRGRDPGTLTIGLDKQSPLELYFPNMCRTMMFHYRKTVSVSGIPAWRFAPSEQTFHSPYDNPDNACYCHDSFCMPSGIFDMGIGCKVSS